MPRIKDERELVDLIESSLIQLRSPWKNIKDFGNTFPPTKNLIERGLARARNTSPKDAQDRLEYLLELHPELNGERISYPKEIHAVSSMLNNAYIDVNKKRILSSLSKSLFSGAFVCLSYLMLNSQTETASNLYSGLWKFMGVAHAALATFSLSILVKSGYNYFKNQLSKETKLFRKFLDDREARFCDYVYAKNN